MCNKITATCNHTVPKVEIDFHKLQSYANSRVSHWLSRTAERQIRKPTHIDNGGPHHKFYALQTKEATEVARALLAHFMTAEFPTIIAHDNGAEFVNKVLHWRNNLESQQSKWLCVKCCQNHQGKAFANARWWSRKLELGMDYICDQINTIPRLAYAFHLKDRSFKQTISKIRRSLHGAQLRRKTPRLPFEIF